MELKLKSETDSEDVAGACCMLHVADPDNLFIRLEEKDCKLAL